MFKHMTVTYLDGTTAECSGRRADVIRFERTYKVAASKMFDEGIYTEYLWFFAWCALGRDGDVASFDEWMENVDSVQIVNDDEEAPPTVPGGAPTP